VISQKQQVAQKAGQKQVQHKQNMTQGKKSVAQTALFAKKGIQSKSFQGGAAEPR